MSRFYAVGFCLQVPQPFILSDLSEMSLKALFTHYPDKPILIVKTLKDAMRLIQYTKTQNPSKFEDVIFPFFEVSLKQALTMRWQEQLLENNGYRVVGPKVALMDSMTESIPVCSHLYPHVFQLHRALLRVGIAGSLHDLDLEQAQAQAIWQQIATPDMVEDDSSGCLCSVM